MVLFEKQPYTASIYTASNSNIGIYMTPYIYMQHVNTLHHLYILVIITLIILKTCGQIIDNNIFCYCITFHHFFISRAKNFEKSGEYANTWKGNDDGAVNTDGPRMRVGDETMMSGNYVTRQVPRLQAHNLIRQIVGLIQLICYVYHLIQTVSW